MAHGSNESEGQRRALVRGLKRSRKGQEKLIADIVAIIIFMIAVIIFYILFKGVALDRQKAVSQDAMAVLAERELVRVLDSEYRGLPVWRIITESPTGDKAKDAALIEEAFENRFLRTMGKEYNCEIIYPDSRQAKIIASGNSQTFAELLVWFTDVALTIGTKTNTQVEIIGGKATEVLPTHDGATVSITCSVWKSVRTT